VPSNSSIRDGNGQRGNGAMGVKEGNVRTALSHAILVGLAVRFWLKWTGHDLFSLLCLGCNTGFHGCVGNCDIFYEILSRVNH